MKKKLTQSTTRIEDCNIEKPELKLVRSLNVEVSILKQRRGLRKIWLHWYITGKTNAYAHLIASSSDLHIKPYLRRHINWQVHGPALG